MTFAHLNRRVHLYFGLALLPWLLMYGASSIPFAHSAYFDARDAAKKLPLWTIRMDRTVDEVPPREESDAAAMRVFGASLMRQAGLEDTSFGVYRQGPNQINVYAYSFRHSTQLKYFVDTRRLTVEDRRFRWDHFFTGMHGRGGFEDERLLVRAWSAIVDLVCVVMILWILSGLYMWWGLPGHRGWGWAAIAAGTVSFIVFTLRL